MQLNRKYRDDRQLIRKQGRQEVGKKGRKVGIVKQEIGKVGSWEGSQANREQDYFNGTDQPNKNKLKK